jgi:catechol 2,3-dioxygenase-like lactoylglutathione lyase family enzyme
MTDRERPVLDQVNLVVKDMEQMATFYGRLGLALEATPEWAPHHRSAEPGPGLGLNLDSQPFARRWDQGWDADTSGVVLGFRLGTRDGVDRLYDELTAAGHAGQQPPYDTFWGARYAVVVDPDGNHVGLMSPSDPAMRRMEPPPD